MKATEFRKLIREEIRKVLKEVKVYKPYSKEPTIYKLKGDNSMYIIIDTNEGKDDIGFEKLPFAKVPGTSVSKFVILYKLDKESKGVIKALGNRLPEIQSWKQVGSFKDNEEFVLANPDDLVVAMQEGKMKKSEFRALIREEIKKALAEVQLDPVNQELKDKYIDAYLTLTIDPYAGDYDLDMPDTDDIEAHAKRYGYEKTLRTIDKHPDVTAIRNKYKMGSQDDPLASKAPGTPIDNLMMRDPIKNLTKKGKMDKRDVERLKIRIKQNLNLKY